MIITVFDGEEQVDRIELAGDVSDYDILVHSSTEPHFPNINSEEDIPEIPEIDPETIDTETNRKTYERLINNPESLVNELRETIFRHHVLTRSQLDAVLREMGYEPRGGSTQSALIVLENVTEEIERVGEGDNEQIVWVAGGI